MPFSLRHIFEGSRMSASLKRCIFCGKEGKLTYEHIFGDWILREGCLERTHQKYEFASISVPNPGEDRIIESRIRAGDPLCSNVPVVCSRCNSGWMSQLQEKARPHLEPMFKGDFNLITRESQKIISRWVCMATITGEHLSRNAENVSVDASDRMYVKTNSSPPKNWRIWIAKCTPDSWPSQWCHVTARIQEHELSYIDYPNIQSTAFRIGNLYVFSLSAGRSCKSIVNRWDWRIAPQADNLLWQIWPPAHSSIPWGLNEFSLGDGHYISTALKRLSDAIAKKHGYIPCQKKAV